VILVADPEVEQGKSTASALAQWGFQPALVHDGVEAILAIQRMLPSAIVIDAALPKMFGFQICEFVKRNESLRDIHVVLVGAIHNRDRYRRPPEEIYGADAYIERQELPESLRPILQGFGLLSSTTESPGAEAAAPAPLIPPAAAPARAMGSTPVMESAPAMNPAPAMDPVPVVEPVPSMVPAPAVEPVPSMIPAPAVEPVPPTAPAPAVEPVPSMIPAPAVEPVPPTAPAPAMEPAPAIESAPEVELAPATKPAVAPPAPGGVAPAASASGDPGIDEKIEQAERLARIVVSDIVLYSKDKFDAAVAAGNVLEAMASEIAEGRSLFTTRVDSSLQETRDFLAEELLRVADAQGKA
jgi:CheY-like chemotaxis protein